MTKKTNISVSYGNKHYGEIVQIICDGIKSVKEDLLLFHEIEPSENIEKIFQNKMESTIKQLDWYLEHVVLDHHCVINTPSWKLEKVTSSMDLDAKFKEEKIKELEKEKKKLEERLYKIQNE